MLECDVFVIGCGPAGSSLAYYLAQKNIKVIAAEKKKNLDNPVRCAGFVPVNIAGLFDFKIRGINNQTECLETYSAKNPSEKFNLISKTTAPGFILDRDSFIRDIASRFTEAGGTLLKGTKVISIRQISDGFTLDLFDANTKNHLVAKAGIIAGADGPLSLAGKHIGSANKSFMPAIQKNPSIVMSSADCNKVFFSPYISCGYGWLFPKTESANIGVGAYLYPANTSASIKDTLFTFIRHLKFSGIFEDNIYPHQSITDTNNCNIIGTDMKDNIYQSLADEDKDSTKQGKPKGTCRQLTPAVTGLIPDSGIVDNPGSKEGLILCGDAAGLCNPITGAGIYNAVYSARLASETIIKSLRTNDLNILQEIKEIYNSQFGGSINRALGKKLIQKNNWPRTAAEIYNRIGHNPNIQKMYFPGYKDDVEFSDLIKQTWVSFRDYWR